MVFTSVQYAHCPHAALICTVFGCDDDHGLAMGFGYRWWSVSLRVSVVTNDEIWKPDGLRSSPVLAMLTIPLATLCPGCGEGFVDCFIWSALDLTCKLRC